MPLSTQPPGTVADRRSGGIGSANQPLLAGLPSAVAGPLVWSGADFRNSDFYTIALQEHEIAEAERALRDFKELKIDGDEINCANFILPTVQHRLAAATAELHHGRGFCLLRGFDSTRYSVEDNLMLYLGISSYVGDQRGLQSKRGAMITHITDSKFWTAPAEKRHGIHTTASLPMHNDMGTEILALQTRQCAKRGGYTNIASSWTVYNDMVRENPEAVQVLATPNWPVQVTGRTSRYILTQLLDYHDNKMMVNLDPGRLGLHHARRDDIPALTDAQREALETLSNMATRHQIRVQTRPGDMLFINNFALLHARDRYVDDESSSRHLVRLWLRNSQLGWDIPQTMRVPWDAAFGPTKTQERLYPVVPAPEYKEPKYTAGSAAFVIEDSDLEEDA